MDDKIDCKTKIRQIDKDFLEDGTPIITSKEDTFSKCPYGSIYVNPYNGKKYLKIEGQADWVEESKINADNTVCLIKDSMIRGDQFVIKTINLYKRSFTYTDKNRKEHTGKITSKGYFIFTLYGMEYIPGKNYLTVYIDNVLKRTTAADNLVEIDATHFCLLDKLEVGHIVSVLATTWLKIGNPYSRLFIENTDSKNKAEIGDIWINKKQYIDNDYKYDEDDYGQKISWEDIKNKPHTLAGYGIINGIKKGTKILTKDIKNFPYIPNKEDMLKTITIKGGDADLINNAAPGLSSNNIVQLDKKGNLPFKLLEEIKNKVKEQKYEIKTPFVKGMIVDWYGSFDNVPKGWKICNGKDGTPDLRDKFIIGAGNKFKEKEIGGAEEHTLAENEIPKHQHKVSIKRNNIELTKKTEQILYPGDHILTAQIMESEKNEYTEYDKKKITPKPFNIMNPYIALFKIIKE